MYFQAFALFRYGDDGNFHKAVCVCIKRNVCPSHISDLIAVNTIWKANKLQPRTRQRLTDILPLHNNKCTFLVLVSLRDRALLLVLLYTKRNGTVWATLVCNITFHLAVCLCVWVTVCASRCCWWRCRCCLSMTTTAKRMCMCVYLYGSDRRADNFVGLSNCVDDQIHTLSEHDERTHCFTLSPWVCVGTVHRPSQIETALSQLQHTADRARATERRSHIQMSQANANN